MSVCYIILKISDPPATLKYHCTPLPMIEVPFDRIGMELVEMLEWTKQRHYFVLVLVDYVNAIPGSCGSPNLSMQYCGDTLLPMLRFGKKWLGMVIYV